MNPTKQKLNLTFQFLSIRRSPDKTLDHHLKRFTTFLKLDRCALLLSFLSTKSEVFVPTNFYTRIRAWKEQEILIFKIFLETVKIWRLEIKIKLEIWLSQLHESVCKPNVCACKLFINASWLCMCVWLSELGVCAIRDRKMRVFVLRWLECE